MKTKLLTPLLLYSLLFAALTLWRIAQPKPTQPQPSAILDAPRAAVATPKPMGRALPVTGWRGTI